LKEFQPVSVLLLSILGQQEQEDPSEQMQYLMLQTHPSNPDLRPSRPELK
jgi:hypothetical protein